MKTETKHTHTQGPWYYGTEEQGRIVIRSSTTGLPYVAQTLSTNARLIAAAPDMLAALKSLVLETSHFIHGDGKNGAIVANELRNAIAAIAKAEGNA